MPKIIPLLLLAFSISSLSFGVGPGAVAGGVEAADVEEAESGLVKAEKKKSRNSRVCKKLKPTGSHIGQRVCLKRKEWDAMERAAQEKLRNSTTHSSGGVSQGG